MRNQPKTIFGSSQGWKGRNRTTEGEALALAWAGTKPRVLIFMGNWWSTRNATWVKWVRSKSQQRRCLSKYFTTCSETSATAVIPVKLSAKLLFPPFCFFPDNKRNLKSSPSWKENTDTVTEQVGTPRYVSVPQHLALNFGIKWNAVRRNLPPLKTSLWLIPKLEKINIAKCCQGRCRRYILTLM